MRPKDCLRRYPLFALLGSAWLGNWLAASQQVAVETGETLFQERTPGAWAYLVCEGQVRVLRTTSSRDVTLGRFGPDETFGEYALLPPGLNTATCRATTDARLLRLPLTPLREEVAQVAELRDTIKQWLRLHEALRFLRQEAFLGFMSAGPSVRLASQFRPASFEPGWTLQADGLHAGRFYYLESGQVRFEAPGDPTRRSSRSLGPGDCFGALGLLGQSGAPMAIAETDVRCQYLERHDFWPTDKQPSHHQTLRPPPHPDELSRLVWVGQQAIADCGLACLAMVARFYRRGVTAEALRPSPIPAIGLSLRELQITATALGLSGQAVRVGPQQVRAAELPAIAHLTDGHYVVVFALGLEGVVLGDPEKGILKVSREHFEQSCSGNLLLLRPAKCPTS